MRIGGGRYGARIKTCETVIASLKTKAAVKTSEEIIDPRKIFAYQLRLKVDGVTANMVRFVIKKISLPRIGETWLKLSVELPEDLRGIVKKGDIVSVLLRYSVLPEDKRDRILGMKIRVRNGTKII